MKNENETNDFGSAQKRDVDIFNAFYEVPKADESILTVRSNFSDITSEKNAEIDIQFNEVDVEYNYYAQEDVNTIENKTNVDAYFSESSSHELFSEKNHQFNYLDEKLSVNPDANTSAEQFLDTNTFYANEGDTDYFAQTIDNSINPLLTYDNTVTNFPESLFITKEDAQITPNFEVTSKEDVVSETKDSTLTTTEVPSDEISEVESEINVALDVPENTEVVSEIDQPSPTLEVPAIDDLITEFPDNTLTATDVSSDEIPEVESEINVALDVPENTEVVSDIDQPSPTLEVPAIDDLIKEIPDNTLTATDVSSDEIPEVEAEINIVLDVPENTEEVSDIEQPSPTLEVPVIDDLITEIPDNTLTATDVSSDEIQKQEEELTIESNKSNNDLRRDDFNVNQFVISDDIITLLKAHTTLVLPKFGALTLIDSDLFTLHFIPYLTFNDGLLVDYMSSKYQLEKQVSENWLVNFIDKLTNDLNSSKICKISGIGTFTKNEDTIIFVQESTFIPLDLVEEELKNEEIIHHTTSIESEILSKDSSIIPQVVSTESEFVTKDKEVDPHLKMENSVSKNKIIKLSMYVAAILLLAITVIYFTNNKLKYPPKKTGTIAVLSDKNKSKNKREELLPKSENQIEKVHVVKKKEQESTIPVKENPSNSKKPDLIAKEDTIKLVTANSNKANPKVKKEQINSKNSVIKPKDKASKSTTKNPKKEDKKIVAKVKDVKKTQAVKVTSTVKTKKSLTPLASSEPKKVLPITKKVQALSPKNKTVIVNKEADTKSSYDEQLKVLNSMIETGYYDVIEEDGKVKLKRKQ